MGRRLPSAFGKATPLDEHKKDLPGAVPASLREVSLKRNKPTFGDLFTNLNSCGVKPLGPGAESDGKALTMFCRLSSFGGELRRPMRGGFWKGWFAPRGCLARKCSFVPSIVEVQRGRGFDKTSSCAADAALFYQDFRNASGIAWLSRASSRRGGP
jgi:hypothetical protein